MPGPILPDFRQSLHQPSGGNTSEVMEPDPGSWEARFGYATNKAMWAVGIPRAIRNVLKWPFLMLVILIGVFVVSPIRMLRRYFARTGPS